MEIVNRPIIVADLDSRTPMYQVVDECGRTIGEKSQNFGYLKPEYDKNGRSRGRRVSFDARIYKAAPPWLKLEVFKIDHLGGRITLHVRK